LPSAACDLLTAGRGFQSTLEKLLRLAAAR
jgi:hypothetical protein